jgi:cell division protein FtsA
VVFAQGAIRHTAVLPIAGDQVTNDIAMALRTPTQHAEEIKLRYACALAHLATAEESIQVPSVGDRRRAGWRARRWPRWSSRATRNCSRWCRRNCGAAAYEDLIAAGIVLTGGASKMDGVVELAEEIFHMPVRLGLPQHVSGLADIVGNPIHATGVGLLIYGSQVRPRASARPASGARSLLQRIKAFVSGEF